MKKQPEGIMDDACDCKEHKRRGLSRRGFIAGAAAASGLAMFGGPVTQLFAAGGGPRRRLVNIYFLGGWDVLLGPDPRDPGRTYSGLDTGTARLPAQYQTPVQVTLGGRQTLLGAPMRALVQHQDIMTVIRGINMNTVSHPTGQAYMHTGMEPSGVRPRTSSLGTVLVAGSPLEDAPPLTNVAITVDSYNLGLRSDATAVPLSSYQSLVTMIQPSANALAPQIEQALERAESMTDSCVGVGYAEVSPGAQIRSNRKRVRNLVRTGVADKFSFASGTAEMNSLSALYGLNGDGSHPAYYIATAAQALKTNLAQCVTIGLPRGFDTHGPEWATTQAPDQEACWNAIAALLTDLRQTNDPLTGRPLIETTTVMAYSEFSRTPRINAAGGRDHWFTNSVVAFGAGLRSSYYGATNVEDLGIVPVDFVTGEVVAPGTGGSLVIRPENVMATIVASAGLDPSVYRADPIRAVMV